MRISRKPAAVRAIIRDGRCAFIGSQSLRTLELDGRREVGLIIRDRDIVRKLKKTFDRDWRETKPGKRQEAAAKAPARKRPIARVA